MTQIVICEKPSQARNLQKALGRRFGEIYPAQGHLIGLKEPEEVEEAWASWGFDILRPASGLFPTKEKPGDGGAKAKLGKIRAAMRKADHIIIATDADREGTLIGGELIEHYGFKGKVSRAYFAAEDEKSLRDAFDNLLTWGDGPHLEYNAGVARQQADQIYNLTMTRATTVALKVQGGAIGVGRVKTPTLAIVCLRELEIQNFKPIDYFEVTASAIVGDDVIEMRHRRNEQERIVDPAVAEAIRSAAEGAAVSLSVEKKEGRQAPSKLLDLPALQLAASKKKGWSAAKTLEIAQKLYSDYKILTYPRAEARYLPENAIKDIPALLAALRDLPSLKGVNIGEPQVRTGKNGIFSDKGLAGCSHHAIAPNVNAAGDMARIYGKLTDDERWLFDTVAKSYAAAVMPDFVFEQTRVTTTIDYVNPETNETDIAPFVATGRIPVSMGWKEVYGGSIDEDGDGEEGGLPEIEDGSAATFQDAEFEAKKTEPPKRYGEGSLVQAMQEAWRFIEDPQLRDRLKEAKGIGTPATRDQVIKGLFHQGQLTNQGKSIIPTNRGMAVFNVLREISPNVVDPGMTAQWELMLDAIQEGRITIDQVLDGITQETTKLVGDIEKQQGRVTLPDAVKRQGAKNKKGRGGAKNRFRKKRA